MQVLKQGVLGINFVGEWFLYLIIMIQWNFIKKDGAVEISRRNVYIISIVSNNTC